MADDGPERGERGGGADTDASPRAGEAEPLRRTPSAKSLGAKIALLGMAAVTVVWALVREREAGPEGEAALTTYVHRPPGVMGTQTMLKAVVARGGRQRAERALRAAEAALRSIERRMSTWIDATEVARLNAAEAGQTVKLSEATLGLLTLSRELSRRTRGAFDPTCRPLLLLWRQAGHDKRAPSPAELAAARARCGWARFELLDGAVRKKTAAAGVDLGGIAKGYAIDRAVEAMAAAKVQGGIVDVGGDVRCFGRRAGGGLWRVGVRDPFRTDKLFAQVRVADRAVCTSGNYFRFVEIGGRRYSHIVDPRTGRTADAAPSVTVIAPEAAVADAWATALSVLGPRGFKLLRAGDGIEAMIVTGKPSDYAVHFTGGFKPYLAEPLPVSPTTAPGATTRSSHEGQRSG